MAIDIPPNRISIHTGGAGRSAERPHARPMPHGRHTAPARAVVNHIPEPESLATLIRSAVAAWRGGVTWDRGTILNVLA